jgi:hypothetical protein
MRALDTLAVSDFTPLRGESFHVTHDQVAFEVKLVEVTEIPREPGGRAPFSLVFEGGPSPPAAQRIYRVEHAQLGAMEVFLVPIAANRYEAVFT